MIVLLITCRGFNVDTSYPYNDDADVNFAGLTGYVNPFEMIY